MDLRRINECEYDRWNKFVETSKQGSVYCCPDYLRNLGTPFSIYGAFDNSTLEAAVICPENPENENEMYPALVPYTPFQGLLFKDTTSMRLDRQIHFEYEMTKSLVDFLAKRYTKLFISNSWQVRDIRAFTWATYFEQEESKKFKIDVLYTSLVDISDKAKIFTNMRDGHRHSLKKANGLEMVTKKETNFDIFLDLYKKTFEKQEMLVSPQSQTFVERIFKGMHKCNNSISFITYCDSHPVSYAYFLTDNKRAYYEFGCSEPDFLSKGCSVKNLYDSFVHLNELGFTEVDLLGVNSPQRGFFKQGFGGRIEPYFILSK